MKTLILFNMSHRFDWKAGIVNRNYHVLRTLQEKKVFDTIIAIDFLPFTAKKKLKVLLKSRPWMPNAKTVFWRWHTRVDQDTVDPHLYWFSALDTRSLEAVLQKLQIPAEDRVVWSYNPLAMQAIAVLQKSQFVFDAVDNWIEHSSYAAKRSELESGYEAVKKNADCIFTVSEGLVDFFDKQDNVFFIPNGVDTEHFSRPACNPSLLGLGQVTAERKRTRKAIIGYHGIIQPRVNLSIVDYLAEKHPEYDFVMVGLVWKEMQREARALSKHVNVRFVGPVSYAHLPEVLHCFDVAIIPHAIDRFTQSMNPLKMYEYLAVGKPIVSTPVAGSDQFQDLVQLAISPEDFSVQIQKALESDSPEMQSRRLHMAEQHRWEQRVDVMLSILEKAKHSEQEINA